jgi:hypothetical protein
MSVVQYLIDLGRNKSTEMLPSVVMQFYVRNTTAKHVNNYVILCFLLLAVMIHQQSRNIMLSMTLGLLVW